MSKGTSTLQRRILDVLPASTTSDIVSEVLPGHRVEEIAFDVGYFNTFKLSKDLDLLRLQLAVGAEDGRQSVTKQQHFTIWRALRSLERRGAARRQRFDDGIGDWWWRV